VAYKLSFHVKEVEFLEYIINDNGVEMFTRKVKAVQSWEILKNLKDILRFLRFINFYRRFRKSFSDMARPIIALT
jgi:hypothetical protein